MKNKHMTFGLLAGILTVSAGIMAQHGLSKNSVNPLHAGIGATWSGGYGGSAEVKLEELKRLALNKNLSPNQASQVRAQILFQAIQSSMNQDGSLSAGALYSNLKSLEGEKLISIAK